MPRALGSFFCLGHRSICLYGLHPRKPPLEGTLKVQGHPCQLGTLHQADEVVLWLRGGKTDPYNRGTVAEKRRIYLSAAPVMEAP